MKISGYDFLEELGDGNAAMVWKAYEQESDRYVAIKILKPGSTETIEQIRDVVETARMAARFKHPNIVQVYSIGEEEGVCYFVMEYVEGLTVSSLINQQGAIDQKEALRIAQAIAEALDAAWTRARLVHRNIKPDNIMLDADGTVKLTDMGVACRSGEEADGQFAGTPNYLSPEQITGTPTVDGRSDMYSLGATLYHMLTGRVPFDAFDAQTTMEKHLNDFLPNPQDVNATISIGTAHLVSRLMMKDASNRFKDWHQAAKYIRKVAAGSMIIPKQNSRAVSTIRPSAIRARLNRNRFAGNRVPLWISMPFWLLLLGFWSYLIYTQVRLPPDARKTAPLINIPSITGWPFGASSGVSAAPSARPEGAPP